MTTDNYADNGNLEEVIAKLEDVRDSVEDVLSDLEDIEEKTGSYRTDVPYGLSLDEENGNGY